MAGRYTYSPYEVDPYPYQQMGSMQSGPRRFFSAVGRFFYRLVLLTLIVGALGGALFALYRNDVLLTMARGAGIEEQYRSVEQRVGAPGWGSWRRNTSTLAAALAMRSSSTCLYGQVA